MTRLIDADALKAVFEEKSSEAVCGVELCKAIISRINEVPTVDAVPVVRCKDCGQREYGCSTFIDHNQIHGFCAWGWKAERKEE